MLVLTRKVGQEIVIGDNIRVTVVKIDGNKVRLSFEAPDDVRIVRQELLARQAEFAEEPQPLTVEVSR